MSVAKVIEISASSPDSFDAAMKNGLAKAASTIKNVRGAWIQEQKVVCGPDGAITEYRVNMKVTFVLG